LAAGGGGSHSHVMTSSTIQQLSPQQQSSIGYTPVAAKIWGWRKILSSVILHRYYV